MSYICFISTHKVPYLLNCLINIFNYISFLPLLKLCLFHTPMRPPSSLLPSTLCFGKKVKSVVRQSEGLYPGGSSVQGILQPRILNEVGCFSLLQGIFPTQGSNSGLPYYSRIIYQLSQQGCLRILEWVAYPFSRGSSWCRNWTGVSYLAGGFFHSWATREDRLTHHLTLKTTKLRLWLIHHSTFKKHENWFTIWMKSKENNYPIYKLLSWNEVLPDIL